MHNAWYKKQTNAAWQMPNNARCMVYDSWRMLQMNEMPCLIHLTVVLGSANETPQTISRTGLIPCPDCCIWFCVLESLWAPCPISRSSYPTQRLCNFAVTPGMMSTAPKKKYRAWSIIMQHAYAWYMLQVQDWWMMHGEFVLHFCSICCPYLIPHPSSCGC